MPTEGDFGGKVGRRPIVEFERIPDLLKFRHEENLGFVEDVYL
jgi:hypothetical protein